MIRASQFTIGRTDLNSAKIQKERCSRKNDIREGNLRGSVKKAGEEKN